MEFNLAQVHESIAERFGERDCVVQGSRRTSWRDFTERTRRLANFLLSQGLGRLTERAGLEPWHSGQNHVALYLYNGPEYLEGMYGAFKSRTVSLNINYRYVADELAYVLNDSRARAIIYHLEFAPRLASVIDRVAGLELLIAVDDGSGQAPVAGSVMYEEVLAGASARRPPVDWSADDLYMVYTGGTTGQPKGVLWRQADIFSAALGGRPRPESDHEYGGMDELLDRVNAQRYRLVTLPAPPLMHGAAQWSSMHTFNNAGTVVMQDDTTRLDAADIWRTVGREKAGRLLIIGDAFARPLLDELRLGHYDLSSLRMIVSGGVALSADLKAELMERIDGLRILDTIGSSESGNQGNLLSDRSGKASTGVFVPAAGNLVLDREMRRELAPGEDHTGWFARSGRIPLGYLGDEEKTRRTFPEIDGVRYSVPGDRARLLPDGRIELLGRESVTVNSGGEKIFVEEVEQALKEHPAVYDAVVTGRPSRRWGQEVVAVVQLTGGARADEGSLRAACAERLASFKLPKAFVFVDTVERSPAGKADYAWARKMAEEAP